MQIKTSKAMVSDILAFITAPCSGKQSERLDGYHNCAANKRLGMLAGQTVWLQQLGGCERLLCVTVLSASKLSAHINVGV
eukprot:5781107-Pleurochrysis_carterae.AAC.3